MNGQKDTMKQVDSMLEQRPVSKLRGKEDGESMFSLNAARGVFYPKQ